MVAEEKSDGERADDQHALPESVHYRLYDELNDLMLRRKKLEENKKEKGIEECSFTPNVVRRKKKQTESCE